MRISKGKILSVSQLEWDESPIDGVFKFPIDPRDNSKIRKVPYRWDFINWKKYILDNFGDIEVEVVKNRKKRTWHDDDNIISFI